MKILLIEDEKNAREALKKIIGMVSPSSHIVGETGYISEAIELVKSLKPEVIFLDIQLEDGTGFEFLEQVENPNFKLVFVTAYDEYAIKAFKYSALDYLMKPIDPKEIAETLEKLEKVILTEAEQKQLLDTLKENLGKEPKKIVLKTHNYTHIINPTEIVRIEADGAYTIFYTKERKIVVSKNLKYYENLLDESFFRCHQSHIVNVNQILRIDKEDNLVLTHEHIVPVSSRKKVETMNYIKGI